MQKNKSHSFVVSKKIAAVVIILIIFPITFASAYPYWENIPPRANEEANMEYVYQPYIPTQGQKVVCIVFDDGWQSQYVNALPILNKYGFEATFGIITGYADEKNPEFMSWSEIVNLADDGQDIASHTYNHENLAFMSNSSINYELSKSKQDLENHGINAPIFVYPYGGGAGNATVESFVAKYYLSARGIESTTVMGTPLNLTQPFDKFSLPAYAIENTTTLSRFTSFVNKASNSTVIIIYYHKIDNEDLDTATTPQVFASEMQYLYDNNFTVMTMKDLLLKPVT
jgi:peptidoglycan/xylan/chitin deacetylase (PgdA/CDA1 family)